MGFKSQSQGAAAVSKNVMSYYLYFGGETFYHLLFGFLFILSKLMLTVHNILHPEISANVTRPCLLFQITFDSVFVCKPNFLLYRKYMVVIKLIDSQ